MREIKGTFAKAKVPLCDHFADCYLVTTRVTEAECCRLPLVPVIVNVNVPVLLPAFTVIVELPDEFTDVGLKLAVAPPVNPLTLKVTVPPNPPDGVTVTLKVVLALRTTVCDDGAAESEKSGVTPDTTSITEVECVRLPLVPVIVSV